MGTPFGESSSSLATRSLACREQLKKLATSWEDCHTQNGWARNQTAQFNIWATNIGVFAEGHHSLDYRLKDIPETGELIALLLSALEKDLLRT